MGKELSEKYDEVAATALDGQEVSPAALEDEGAGSASTRVRLRRHRCSGARAAALEDRRHAVVVATKCRGRIVQSAAVWKKTSTF